MSLTLACTNKCFTWNVYTELVTASVLHEHLAL